jgi:hypothetical protein
VALLIAIGKTPVAKGSRVPQCPTFEALVILLTIATTLAEE